MRLNVHRKNVIIMKANFEFYIYPENKIYLNELDEQEKKELYNYLKPKK